MCSSDLGPMTRSIGSTSISRLADHADLTCVDHHTRRDDVPDTDMTFEVQGKFHSTSVAASMVAPPC